MHDKVFLSLGSNLGNCTENLDLACQNIALIPGVKILAKSKIWQTEPQNYKDQSWFYNQVIAIESQNLEPEELLAKTMELEQKLGRVRTDLDFGPRTIDIDILLFNDLQFASQKLIIPHPRMLERAFVLIPLQELAFNISIANKPLAFYLQKLSYKVEAACIWQS